MEIKAVDIDPKVRQAKSRFGIVGNSQLLNTGVQRALQVAPINLSVLVTGESGTGKEFFPRLIHEFSSRKHNRYIAVNCGAIPEGTIDSELFGHEKGAFTGAIATRKGYFEEANGGTIFLDEVGELPLSTQARLLRVLETGEFMKVGSSTVQRTDVRIVAATNVDMPRAIEQGRFREDLFYRLSTVGIKVPPLRDRGDDVVLLARKFAFDFSQNYRMPQPQWTPDAYDMLMRYRWPGNVRQLKNIVEQVGLFEAGNKVDAQVLEGYLPAESLVYSPAVGSHEGVNDSGSHSYAREREVLFNMVFKLRNELDSLRSVVDSLRSTGAVTHSPLLQAHNPVRTIDIVEPEEVDDGESPRILTLDQTERRAIEDALAKTGGKRKEAAAMLNISERTLYRKIKDYGLEL